MLAPRKPTLCWSICFSDTARGKSEWRRGSPSREPEGTSSPPAPGRRGAGAGGPPRPHVTSAGRRRGRGCWGLRRPPPPCRPPPAFEAGGPAPPARGSCAARGLVTCPVSPFASPPPPGGTGEARARRGAPALGMRREAAAPAAAPAVTQGRGRRRRHRPGIARGSCSGAAAQRPASSPAPETAAGASEARAPLLAR